MGNRTPEIRAGVVFPEAGIGWLEKEIEDLPSRPQDPFRTRPEDVSFFTSSELHLSGKAKPSRTIFTDHTEMKSAPSKRL